MNLVLSRRPQHNFVVQKLSTSTRLVHPRWITEPASGLVLGVVLSRSCFQWITTTLSLACTRLPHIDIHMTKILLASASETRLSMLGAAGLEVTPHPARVDESALREALAAEGATPRDISDALAEAKAQKIASRYPDAMVLGADQVLDQDGQALGKAADPDALVAQLRNMREKSHRLHSAAVLYQAASPVWRHISTAQLWVRPLSDAWIDAYVARNWDSIRSCAGGYRIEGEGVRLFSRIEGDYFTILGLPLLPLLDFLIQRKDLPS